MFFEIFCKFKIFFCYPPTLFLNLVQLLSVITPASPPPHSLCFSPSAVHVNLHAGIDRAFHDPSVRTLDWSTHILCAGVRFFFSLKNTVPPCHPPSVFKKSPFFLDQVLRSKDLFRGLFLLQFCCCNPPNVFFQSIARFSCLFWSCREFPGCNFSCTGSSYMDATFSIDSTST